MSAEEEVRSASQQFYVALNRMANGDAGPMAEIWSRDTATAMHPIGGREVGWDAVRDSFAQVARSATGGAVELRDQLITVVGDTACEIGRECGHLQLAGMDAAIDFRVTNLYRREAGGWKIIHHHTDVSQAMLDVLKRLPPP